MLGGGVFSCNRWCLHWLSSQPIHRSFASWHWPPMKTTARPLPSENGPLTIGLNSI